MYDYFQKFIPVDERTPKNANYDWMMGLEGKGYSMVSGAPVPDEEKMGLAPATYILRRFWAPSDEATELAKLVSQPLAKKYTQSTIDGLKSVKFYVDPINSVHSKIWAERETELTALMNVHQTKMILGNESIDDWDKAVKEFLDKGGQAAIDEANQQMTKGKITGSWK